MLFKFWEDVETQHVGKALVVISRVSACGSKHLILQYFDRIRGGIILSEQHQIMLYSRERVNSLILLTRGGTASFGGGAEILVTLLMLT